VKVKHRRIDIAKRRGAISDAAEARASRFGKIVTEKQRTRVSSAAHARQLGITTTGRTTTIDQAKAYFLANCQIGGFRSGTIGTTRQLSCFML